MLYDVPLRNHVVAMSSDSNKIANDLMLRKVHEWLIKNSKIILYIY